MAEEVIVTRLVIDAQTQGVDEATRALNAMGKAQDTAATSATGLGRATSAADRSFAGAEASLEKLRAKHDASYRAVRDFSREIERTTSLHRMLGTSATEAAADMAALDARFAALIARAGGMSTLATELARTHGLLGRLPSGGVPMPVPTQQIEGAASALGNAEYKTQLLRMQMTDLATMMAMGGSPFQAMISQSGQISDALAGTRGVKGALSLVGSAAMSLLSPVNLAIAGFAGLAYGISEVWDRWNAGAPTVEEALKRQATLATQLKQIYGEAADNAARVKPPELSELRFTAGMDLKTLQAKSVQDTKDFLQDVGNFNRGGLIPEAEFAPFVKQLNELYRTADAGRPAIDQFRADIIAMAAVAPDAAQKLLELSRAIQDVTTPRQNDFLARLDPAAISRALRTGQGYEALDKAMGSFTGIHDPNAPKPTAKPIDALDTIKGTEAQSEAAYRSLIVTADQRIAQLKTEAATWGMTKEAADAYRIGQEAINKALADGIKLSADQVAAIKSKAAEEAHLIETQRQFEAQKQASEQAARQIVEDQKRAAEEASQFWETSLSGALKSLSHGGDPKKILLDMGFKIGDRLIDEGVAEMFGKNGGGTAGGGIIDWLLGGKPQQPTNPVQALMQQQTVGMMTVQAGTVSILGGLPGITPPAGAGAGIPPAVPSAAAPVTSVTRLPLGPPATAALPSPDMPSTLIPPSIAGASFTIATAPISAATVTIGAKQ